jgi:hypothetical protein
MSRVHDAMRNLEHKSAPEKESGGASSNLVGALIEELADEIQDNSNLESVRTDLLAVSRSYETCKKKDLALRFYLATRSLLREYEMLHERLRRAEKKNQSLEAVPTPERREGASEVHTLEPAADHRD